MAAQGFDGTFDEPWETCYPDGTNAVGIQPMGWMASSVYKMGMEKELVGQEADRSGNANGHSVRMWNDYVGIAFLKMGATAPGYLTLGTSWAYGDVANVGKPNDTSDGGAYGGVEFTSRPDSLTFYVKRTHAQTAPSAGSFNKEEKATVVFYMWKGHSVSKVTTGMSTSPVEMDMQDREKDILGKITEGVSGDAQLVASNEYYIEGDIADWTRMSIAVDYKDKENKVYPEMMNIIFSASDYFNRPAMGTGNDLTVDDVKLIYNSRLKSVTFGGVEVPHFDDGTFEYQLAADRQSEDIQAEAYGKDAQVEVVTEGNVVTITVTDETAQGETKNVYTFTFKGQETVIETPEAAPAITYGDEGIDLGFKSNNPGAWEYSFSTEGVLEQGEDGKLSAMGAGEVIVTVSQAGTDEFAPAVSESLTVTVDKAPLTVALADTSWCWRGVSVSTSNVTNGKCAYGFAMNGLKGRDEGKTAEEIFSTLPTVRATAVDGEKPGDKRVATLSGGAADNYELTFAEDNLLNIVKNKVGVYVRYASHTLSTAYSGENYRTVKVAAGQDEYYFTVNYADACEGDAEILEAAGMPEVVCGVTKEAQIGEEFPVSVVLSQTEFEDFDVVSIVPETAKVVVAANPNVTVDAMENVKYGDVFKLPVKNDGGITSYNYTSLNSVASVNYSGNVTIEKAGEAVIMVTTMSKTVEGTEYGATTTRVVFEAQKAPLTVKAKDVMVDVADGLPEVFELEYEGWVGDDTEETVFTTAPVASVELPGGLAVGTYPIVVTVSEEPENYEVQAVNGTLTVTNADGVDAVTRGSGKVTYANGNLYVPCGGNVEVYSLTGALVGQYEGTVIPVALRANTLYIVKTQEGAYRILVK